MGKAQGLAIYALTPRGLELARSLAAGLGADVFAPVRMAGAGEQGFDELGQAVRENFQAYIGHVFVAACGIVVRLIAPLIQDKKSDPAVVVLDQAGKFAVSLLSGHLGGANDLARRIALLCGAQAVITTATDAVGAPAVEVLARDLGLAIENSGAVKHVNSALASGQRVQLCDPLELFRPSPGQEGFFEWLSSPDEIDPARPSVLVSYRELKELENQVVLRPRLLCLGMGCRKGVPKKEILAAFAEFCQAKRINRGCFRLASSIELKRHEPGLLEAAAELGLETIFFPAEELAAIDAPSPSQRVKKYTGAASVCEASAILASQNRRLAARKFIHGRVTLAAAY